MPFQEGWPKEIEEKWKLRKGQWTPKEVLDTKFGGCMACPVEITNRMIKVQQSEIAPSEKVTAVKQFRCSNECYEGYPTKGEIIYFEVLFFSHKNVVESLLHELFNSKNNYCLKNIVYYETKIMYFIWIHNLKEKDTVYDTASKLALKAIHALHAD